MKENKRALIVIGILVLCCIACILYLFVNRVHMPNVSYMSIKQADLTDTEREMFSLFDSGTTDLFDFRVNTSDIKLHINPISSLVIENPYPT